MSGINSRFLLGSLIDQATLTASSATSSLPVNNLKDGQRTKVWRSTSAANQTIDIDLGEGNEQEISALAVLNHNLTVDGVFTISAGSSLGASNLMYQEYSAWEPLFGCGESGFGDHGIAGYLTPVEMALYFPAGAMRLIYFDPVSARYWRIGLKNATNPNGYLEAGRLILDRYRESSRMISIGSTLTPFDPSLVTYSKGGQLRRDARTKYRTGAFRYEYIPSNQTYGLFFDMLQTLGAGVSFVADLHFNDALVSRRVLHQVYCHIPQGATPPMETAACNFGHVELTLRESR